MNTATKTEHKPRNPWPYAIIAWFVIFITAMTVWAVVATRNSMDLVRKDYYEEELRHQQQIERPRGALSFGAVSWFGDAETVRLELFTGAHLLKHHARPRPGVEYR